MSLTVCDMEKLMRMVYDEKLKRSLMATNGHGKDRATLRRGPRPVQCEVCPSGAPK